MKKLKRERLLSLILKCRILFCNTKDIEECIGILKEEGYRWRGGSDLSATKFILPYFEEILTKLDTQIGFRIEDGGLGWSIVKEGEYGVPDVPYQSISDEGFFMY